MTEVVVFCPCLWELLAKIPASMTNEADGIDD